MSKLLNNHNHPRHMKLPVLALMMILTPRLQRALMRIPAQSFTISSSTLTFSSKHAKLQFELETIGTGIMQAFGNSMLPILPSGVMLTFEKRDSYCVGDIVFCKVQGRFIDAHKITKIRGKDYMIANNRGFENGWTKTIYGKVIL